MLFSPKYELKEQDTLGCFSIFSARETTAITAGLRSLFVLLPFGSCLVWSVYLTTLLLGRINPLSG